MCRFIVLSLALAIQSAALGNYNSCWRRNAAPVDPPVWSGDVDSFFDDYRTYDEISSFLDKLAKLYPALVTEKTIGNTSEGRPIRALEISDRTNAELLPLSERPRMHFQAGIHAREWISISTALFMTYKLLTEQPEALERYVFVSMPLLNPDGYEYTWKVDRMWRKNRKELQRCTRSSADFPGGTDLNRNWGYTWRTTPDRGYLTELRDPCSNVFAGMHPFSDPETVAVSQYLLGLQNKSLAESSRKVKGGLSFGPGYVASFIDFHNWGQVILPPWSYKTELSPDSEYQKQMNIAQVAAIKDSSGKTFTYGPNEFPPDPGTAPDWAYGVLGVRASMTIELDPLSWDLDSHGRGSFCIDKVHIKPVGLGQWSAYKALIAFCDSVGCQPSATVGTFAINVPTSTADTTTSTPETPTASGSKSTPTSLSTSTVVQVRDTDAVGAAHGQQVAVLLSLSAVLAFHLRSL